LAALSSAATTHPLCLQNRERQGFSCSVTTQKIGPQ
jgi:hypothetical protein